MAATPSVVWQPVAAIATRFAIESASPIVLQRARLLFAPWLVKDDATGEIAYRWHIEADNADENADQWSLIGASEVSGDAADSLWRGLSLTEMLTQIEYAALGQLVARLPAEFIGLHGALLSREFDGARRAVIVVGPKEAGKSTLACALWKAGWALHCDDFTLLQTNGRAWPTARRVSLRNGSRALLGEELWQSARQTPSARPASSGVLFHPHEIDGQARACVTSLEVSAICFLQRRDVQLAPAQSALVSGMAAALALLPYSNLLFEDGDFQASGDWGAQLATIATTLENADISLYDLGRAEPAAMIGEIERLVRLKL